MALTSLGQARYLARKVVSEAGFDFKYLPRPGMSCVYVPLQVARENWPYEVWQHDFSATPDPLDQREVTGCLVGRILDEAGETYHRTSDANGEGIETAAISMHLSYDITIYLRVLQDHQDGGKSWGHSWAAGEKNLAERRLEY